MSVSTAALRASPCITMRCRHEPVDDRRESFCGIAAPLVPRVKRHSEFVSVGLLAVGPYRDLSDERRRSSGQKPNAMLCTHSPVAGTPCSG